MLERLFRAAEVPIGPEWSAIDSAVKKTRLSIPFSNYTDHVQTEKIFITASELVSFCDGRRFEAKRGHLVESDDFGIPTVFDGRDQRIFPAIRGVWTRLRNGHLSVVSVQRPVDAWCVCRIFAALELSDEWALRDRLSIYSLAPSSDASSITMRVADGAYFQDIFSTTARHEHSPWIEHPPTARLKKNYVLSRTVSQTDACAFRTKAAFTAYIEALFNDTVRICGTRTTYGEIPDFEKLIAFKNRVLEAALADRWYPPLI